MKSGKTRKAAAPGAPRGRVAQMRPRARAARRRQPPALTRFAAALLQNASDAILLVRPDGAIVDANTRAGDMYGYSREELLRLPVAALRDATTLPALAGQLARARREGIRFETVHRRRDGTTFPVEVGSSAITAGGATYLLSIVRDVSDRHAAVRSERRFQAAFERAGFGILLVDGEGRVRDHNAALAQLLGRAPEALRGAPLVDLYAPADVRRARHGLATLVSGERDGYVEERRYRRADDSEVPVLVRAVALRDGAGRFEGALAIVEDLSEVRALEAQADVSDRLAALGTIAGGLVHELSSPVAAVLSDLGFAVDALARPEVDVGEVRRVLEEARGSVSRVRELLREVRIFARGARPHGDAERVDPERVIRALVTLAGPELRPEARLELAVEPGVPEVRAGAEEVALLVLKLLLNATEAVRGREDRQVAVSVAREGAFVALRVRDHGPVIPPDHLPRVFDASGAAPPGRRGHGLAGCRSLAEGLGGAVRVESGPAEGTVFTVLLPAAN